MQVVCGTMGLPTATVRMRGPDGISRAATGMGSGPFDAACKAVDSLLRVQVPFSYHSCLNSQQRVTRWPLIVPGPLAVAPGRSISGRRKYNLLFEGLHGIQLKASAASIDSENEACPGMQDALTPYACTQKARIMGASRIMGALHDKQT